MRLSSCTTAYKIERVRERERDKKKSPTFKVGVAEAELGNICNPPGIELGTSVSVARYLCQHDYQS